VIPVVIGSELWGETAAIASELGRERIVVHLRAEVFHVDTVITVHIGDGGAEMVARARVAAVEGPVDGYRCRCVLEVLDWDDQLGCLLPSEKGDPT
jgi:hypothetical protein